jgi:4-carboxymuconolactone decarboxylase
MAGDSNPDGLPGENSEESGFPTAVNVAGEEEVQRFIEALAPVGSRMSDLVLDVVFERLHADPVLSHVEREMIALAVLAALGGTAEQIRLHLRISHRLGTSPEEVMEIFAHVGPYAGFPRALGAIEVAKSFYGELGLLPL